MNLKRIRPLTVSSLPLILSVLSACAGAADPSAEGAAPSERVGAAAQAVVTTGSVLQVSGGELFTLAVMSDGTVSSWGDNTDSQLGYGTTGSQLVPAQIPGLSFFKAVSAAGSSDSFGLRSDGTLWAWGSNTWGQLGIGQSSFSDVPTPTQVSGLSGVIAASAGNNHAVAVQSDGTVWAWGFNGNGQAGNGITGGNYDAPVQVQALVSGALVPLTDVTTVAAGNASTIALKSDGTVWGWGWNNHGETGNGDALVQNAAVQAMVGGAPLSGIISVALGLDGASSYALASDGTLWSWGNNGNGELGYSTGGADEHTPTQVMLGGVPFSGVTAVVSFRYSTLALRSDGTVWAWGYNNGFCQLAKTGGGSSTPLHIAALSGVTAIAAGSRHAFAQTSDGKLWAWGDDSDGQLGDGTTTTACTPEVVLSP